MSLRNLSVPLSVRRSFTLCLKWAQASLTEASQRPATTLSLPTATSGMALLTEGLLTFFFVFVILAATDAKKGAGKFAGLAIGIAIGLVNIVGIPVDNCSVNPARSFGPAVFSPNAWGDFWIMVVGPLVGAAVAVLCWKAIAGTDKNSVE